MAKKQIFVFLGLTFGLTYLLNLLGFLKLGLIKDASSSEWTFFLSAQMLIPAASAFLTMLIFRQKFGKVIRSFFLIFLLIAVWSLVKLYYDPLLFSQTQNGITVNVTLSMIGVQVVSLLGAIFILVANFKKNWREEMEKFKLSFGRNKKYFLISMVILVSTLTLSVFLNYFLGLGKAALRFDPTMFFTTILLALFFAPISNWAYFLGEEYGWRVFLQDRLLPLMGNSKGVLVLGVIWGLWHTPVIAMGYNYPGYPLVGVLCMTIFTVLLGVIYSWAVIKTKSVWSAVWLHLTTNNLIGLGVIYVAQPTNPVFSFGIGLYGLLLLAIVSGILLFKTKEYGFKKLF
jgi:membrane protease YdiL (CAAX protease family)